MHKKLLFTLTLVSTSLFPLNFDKEFSEIKKTATAIGSDSWDRASFENNIFTKLSNFVKCKTQRPTDKNHEQKCKERLTLELNQQLSQDGKHLLKLLVASIAVNTIGSVIEHTVQTVVDNKTATNTAKAITVVPNTVINVLAFPLIINFFGSIFNKVKA